MPPNTPNEITAKKPDSDNTKQPKDEAYWERKQFKVQRLIACAGILDLGVYGFQLWEMHKATNAATDGLALTREMTRLDQRAWVAPSGVTGEVEAGKPIIAYVNYKNTGKTFARNANVRAKLEFVPKGAEPNYDSLFDPPRDGTKPAVMILAPNGEYAVETDPLADSPFTQENFDYVRDRNELFLYGRITYADVFDRDHWLTFCFRYNFKSGNFVYHHKHNEDDKRSGD